MLRTNIFDHCICPTSFKKKILETTPENIPNETSKIIIRIWDCFKLEITEVYLNHCPPLKKDNFLRSFHNFLIQISGSEIKERYIYIINTYLSIPMFAYGKLFFLCLFFLFVSLTRMCI